MSIRLEGKTALVTGAADGIGKVIAMKLAANGANIVIADRNIELGTKTASEIAKLGVRATAQEVDLWDYKSTADMVNRAVAEMGRVDICIACGAANAKYAKYFHDADPLTDYEGNMKVHYHSRLYTVRAVLDHMRKQNYGKIILITSDAGRTPTPRESLIGAAAAGLIIATKGMAGEFARWQIRINCLCLTLIEGTPAQKSVESTEAKDVFAKVRQRARLGIPTSEDVAEAALFLASPESDRITGAILSVNGGLSFPG